MLENMWKSGFASRAPGDRGARRVERSQEVRPGVLGDESRPPSLGSPRSPSEAVARQRATCRFVASKSEVVRSEAVISSPRPRLAPTRKQVLFCTGPSVLPVEDARFRRLLENPRKIRGARLVSRNELSRNEGSRNEWSRNEPGVANVNVESIDSVGIIDSCDFAIL